MLKSAPGFGSHQEEEGDKADDALEVFGRGHWKFEKKGCQFSDTVNNPSNVLRTILLM